MRRADYLTLAAACAKHRNSALTYGAMASTEAGKAQERGKAEGIEAVARTFARFAHLGGIQPAEFLRLCGLP